MANYTAADIKALRASTGAGMLDVKKALDEADGDHGRATEILRVKGLKGVTKREGRTTSNGLVIARAEGGAGTLVEVLCETDFVAKGSTFIALADQVFAQAVETKAASADELLASTLADGTTVYECTSTDEVVDLLQGGQAVFAIAVGRHVRDVEGTLAALPGERATGAGSTAEAPTAADELASRRKRRTTA